MMLYFVVSNINWLSINDQEKSNNCIIQIDYGFPEQLPFGIP
jgi:hypothetical protein